MNIIKRKLSFLNHYRFLKKYNNLKTKIKKFENSSLAINDLDVWKKKLLKVSKCSETFLDVSDGFFSTNINILKQSVIDDKSEIILICVVKDDLKRMSKFIEYYRNFGIKHFAILDDKSTDGTREFLMEQNDVDVFSSTENYSTNMRQSWINRIIAYYGLNRWYMVFDSDEFLTTKYNCIQEMIKTIGTSINYRCLMVDMYPIDNYSDDFLDSFIGFDINTYEYNKRNIWFNCITGGMRKRVFSTHDKKVNPYLIKTPVFYASKMFVQIYSHCNYPFSYDNDFVGIIRHYKFLKEDLDKFVLRAEKKNFANNSNEYSAYIDKLSSDVISFVNNETCKYENYESFYNINVYKKNKYN